LPPSRKLRRLAFRVAAWFDMVGRAIWRGSVNFYRSDDLTHAAAVAYYALLSVFPFFLLLFSILGLVASRESRHQAVVAFLNRAFPAHIDFLAAQLDALQKTRVRLGLGSLLALAWSALGFFSAISSAVNYAWRVERPRSYLRHKLFSFFMLMAAGLMLTIALIAGSVFQMGQATWVDDLVLHVPALAVLGGFFLRYAAFFLFVIVVGLIFYFVPNAPVRLRDVWPGAVLTGLAWQVALEGFAFYLRDMSRFNFIHGSMAAVVVFLVWVYTSSVVLLYGVEFTAAYARLRRGRAGGESAT
jgi:membrane protein